MAWGRGQMKPLWWREWGSAPRGGARLLGPCSLLCHLPGSPPCPLGSALKAPPTRKGLKTSGHFSDQVREGWATCLPWLSPRCQDTGGIWGAGWAGPGSRGEEGADPWQELPWGLGKAGSGFPVQQESRFPSPGEWSPLPFFAEAASWPVQGVTGSMSCGVCRNLLSVAPESFSWGSWARLFTPLHDLCLGSLGALEKHPSRAAVIDFPRPSTQLTEPLSRAAESPAAHRWPSSRPTRSPPPLGGQAPFAWRLSPSLPPANRWAGHRRRTPGQEGTHRGAKRIPELPGLRPGLPPALAPAPHPAPQPLL